jgi:DNA polymerase III alpha subunit
MPAVAVTDNGNLFGALEFATACAEAGIQPIIGCEIALLPNGGARTAAPRTETGTATRPSSTALSCWSRTRPAIAT